MTDQIADLITRIRNATAVKKTEVLVCFSKMNQSIAEILKKEGFLTEIVVNENDGKKSLLLKLSVSKRPSHIEQISKPGRRVYSKAKFIPKPLRGLGLVIVSTPDGLLPGREAGKRGMGGELICKVW
ncbi:MAG: 30S ribosomal protein S8 [Candidatus Berkelbacteria bacterium]